jgi:hypothetical protein
MQIHELPELMELLCDDLDAQDGAVARLRGVAIPAGDGLVVIDERWRPIIERGRDESPPVSPLPVLTVRDDAGRLVVSARSPEPPYARISAPLAGLGVVEEVGGPASAVALAATLLVDPTDLHAARTVQDRVPVIQLPVDGRPGSLPRWIDMIG